MLTTRPLRTLLVALAALALGTSSAVALPLGDADATRDATRAVVDLSGMTDRTTTVQAATVPAASHGIGPGSPLRIEIEGVGAFGCTASWVFTVGTELLLGAAGHCFLPEDVATTHGSGASGFDRADTTVSVCVTNCAFGGISAFLNGGYLELGPLVYARQESAGGAQVGWDFGVVQIPSESEGLVRRSMPVFGGPSGDGTLRPGDQVCHYGNGVAVGEAFPTKARSGLGRRAGAQAWYVATAAALGDSGSALQTCTTTATGITGATAVGTLTHLTTSGVAGTTNARSIELAAADAGLHLQLALDGAGSTTSDGGSTDSGSTSGNGNGNGNGGGGGGKKPKG